MLSSLLLPKRHNVVYDLHENFRLAWPVANGSVIPCSPGPGRLTYTAADGSYARTAGTGLLAITGQSSPAWGDLGFVGPAQVRQPGLMLLSRIAYGGSAAINPFLGWITSTTPNPDNLTSMGFSVVNAEMRLAKSSTTNSDSYILLNYIATSTTYEVAVILRSTGSFVFTRDVTNGTTWRLEAIDNTDNDATVYPACMSWSGNVSVDFFRVPHLHWLPQPTLNLNPNTSTEYEATADQLLFFDITYTTGLANRVLYRYADESNHLYVECTSAGAFQVVEVSGGASTTKVSAIAGVWTNGTTRTVVCRITGNTHQFWTIASGTITARGSAFTSTVSQTEPTIICDFSAGGAVANLVSYKRDWPDFPAV